MTADDLVIDVYCHCGRSKYQPLPVVQEALEAGDVARAVLVQHLGEYDNSYIADAVAAEPHRFVGVFHVDPEGNDPIAEIERHASLAEFEGVRFEVRLLHRIRDQYEAAVELGLNIVLCSILGMHDQLPELRAFLGDHPEHPLMITHWGWPALADAPEFSDYQNVLALSEYPGVFLQASGMSMYSDHYLELFRPAAAAAYEAFGPDRMVWGSNFSVSGGDPAGYAAELAPFRQGQYPFAEEDLPAILGGTAKQLWFG
ncbi:MAG: amidohydrolase family protein [Acidimicrobiales bacterium]